jgi:hypothetical protein
MNDMMISKKAWTDEAVGEIVGVWAAALAGDSVDGFDAIGAHLIKAFGRQGDDVVLAYAGLEGLIDVLVHAVNHRRGHIQQRQFVLTLDHPRFEHDLLAVAHLDAEILEREEERRLNDVYAEGHVSHPFSLEDVPNLLGGLLEQARFR